MEITMLEAVFYNNKTIKIITIKYNKNIKSCSKTNLSNIGI